MKSKRMLGLMLAVAVLTLVVAAPVAAQLPTTDVIDMDWVQSALQGGFWLFGLFVVFIGVVVSIIFGSRLINAVIGAFSKHLKIG